MRIARGITLAGLFFVAGAAAFGSAAHATNLGLYSANDTQETEFVWLWSEFDVVSDAHFFESGAIVALNRDLSRAGFVVYLSGGTGDYEYDSSTAPGGTVDADLTILDALLGYQVFTANTRFAAYAGVDWQDHDLTPKDPSNPVSGSEAGFIVRGEIETLEASPFYLSLEGFYSTAYDTYWARVRPGYRFGNTIIGPEGVFSGVDESDYNAQRLGGFVSLPIEIKTNVAFYVTAAAGYEWVDQGGGEFGGIGGSNDSAYGTLTVATSF